MKLRSRLCITLLCLLVPLSVWAEDVPPASKATIQSPQVETKDMAKASAKAESIQPDNSEFCDAECVTKKAGLLALPPGAAIGSAALFDKFPIHENVIYSGLPGQAMTESDIKLAMKLIRSNKAFERSNQIVVDSSSITTAAMSDLEFEEKLRRYSSEGNGVSRVAIRNPRVVSGTAIAAALSTALFIALEFNPSLAGQRGASEHIRGGGEVKTRSTTDNLDGAVPSSSTEAEASR